MREIARFRRALIPAIVSMATAAVGAPAHGAAVTPPPLGARDIFTLVERSAPGVLDHDAWLVIEQHLERADTERLRLVSPRIAELWSRSEPQDWLNWPAIKAAPMRHAREAAIDAQLEVERSFLASAAAELDPITAAALEHAMVARGRKIVGAWPLFDAAPADLQNAFHRVVPRRALDDEAWRAASRIVDEWSTEQWRSLVAQRALRRSAYDALDAVLGELGVDLANLPAPDDERFVAAFDAWERLSEPLAKQTRALLALERRTLERLKPLLPESLWTALVDEVMSNGLRHSSRSNRAFVDYDFERARRIRALTPEARAAVAARHARWRADDAALFLRWSARYAAMAPAWCPLTYGHWGPQERYRPLDAERGRLADQRYECSKRASQELRAILGPHAALLEGDEKPDDDRFEPLPKPEQASGLHSVDFQGHQYSMWHPRPGPGLAMRAPPTPYRWFDPGPISEGDAERLGRWIGLTDDGRSAWLEMHRDLVARLATVAAGVPESSWALSARGPVFDHASAARRLEAARRHEALLAELEEEWWRAAESLVTDDESRRRLRVSAMAREIQRRLDLLERPTAMMFRQRRCVVPLPWIMVGTLVNDMSDAGCGDGGHARVATTEEDRLLREVEPIVERVLEAVRARSDAIAEEARRTIVLMWDENPWPCADERVDARHRYDERRRRLNDAVLAYEAMEVSHCGRFTAIQSELLDRLREFEIAEIARSGVPVGERSLDRRWRRGMVAIWESLTYPSELGWDPPIAEQLLAGEPQAELRERLCELGVWHRARDLEVVEDIMAVVDAVAPATALDPEAGAALQSKLEQLRARRAELSDRAEVRRRLLWRTLDPEHAIPASDERGWSRLD